MTPACLSALVTACVPFKEPEGRLNPHANGVRGHDLGLHDHGGPLGKIRRKLRCPGVEDGGRCLRRARVLRGGLVGLVVAGASGSAGSTSAATLGDHAKLSSSATCRDRAPPGG